MSKIFFTCLLACMFTCQYGFAQDITVDSVKIINNDKSINAVITIKNKDDKKLCSPVFIHVEIKGTDNERLYQKTLQLQTKVLQPLQTQSFSIPLIEPEAERKTTLVIKQIIIKCDATNLLIETSETNNEYKVTEQVLNKYFHKKGIPSGSQL